ncbi:hypothetical protein N7G274_007702 [Stereocaulon virgatum]|uniref:Polynucleotide 5'-hydroxyl-kinase GRC3 n=1 Tax=Stereocaulon virgatum TaxID=373712 RepID=A0ABR4A1X4_9LECA
MTRPVSAFAARKAAHPSTTVLSTSFKTDDLSRPEARAEVDNSRHPRKRRRDGERPRSLHVSQPAIEEAKLCIPIEEHEEIKANREDGSCTVEDGESNSSDLEAIPQNAGLVHRLSSFIPTESNVLSETDTEWTIRLQRNDTLAIIGQYDLWVRSGAINVHGAVIHASSKLHRVYAPSTHAIPSIRPILNPYGTGNPPVELTIISCGSRIRMLKQIAPKFGRIWNGRELRDGLKRSFINVQSSAEDPYKRPLRLLESPPDWQDILSHLLATNKEHLLAVMVCGPKRAGKSTFCRMLANALLSKPPTATQEADDVALLDLDPGQPEYSPPGDISLLRLRSHNLGPPFTHPTVFGSDQVIRAHHIGYLSPKDDPQHYYSCAIDLFGHYQRMTMDQGSCPLIINCAGWIQGSGLELLVNLVHSTNLTNIVYMSVSGPEEVIDVLNKAASRTGIPLHHVNSQATEIPTRSAADLRMMQTLSYFHLDEPEWGNLRWNPCPMGNTPPLVIHYTGPKQAILGVMVLGDEQNPNFFNSILEGCLVSITVVEIDRATWLDHDSDDGHESDASGTGNEVVDEGVAKRIKERNGHNRHQRSRLPRTPTGIPYIPAKDHTVKPLSPTTSHCIGHAIIRGIDIEAQAFHLTTSVSACQLANAQSHPDRDIVLVRGRLDTPTWAFAEQMNLQRERARRRERELNLEEENLSTDIQALAAKQPWASTVEGSRTGSGKIRRIRRDIRYKGQGPVDSSS